MYTIFLNDQQMHLDLRM